MINLNHSLILYFEKLILFFSKILSLFKKKTCIRILVYHDIEDKNFILLFNQLKYLRKNWNFITPTEFENHLNNKRKLNGKNLLITFDDGFKSNYFVAKKILNKLNIKGIFFVPSDFVQIKSKKKALNFAKQNILDNFSENKENNIYNISINNMKSLIKSGHTIGCHTKTHLNLGLLNNKKKLKDEILESANRLKKLLRIDIKHFAFTYGNFSSMSENSLKLAFLRYDFVYSCMRGNNFYNNKKSIIKRDTIYLEKGNNLIDIFLSGFIDLKYFNQVREINKIIHKF